MGVIVKRRIAKRPVAAHAASAQLIATRAMMGGVIAAYPRHADAIISCRSYRFLPHHDVRCLVITPPTVKGRMLYFHGGGFRLGSPEIVAGFTSHLAVHSNCEIVIPFYSLAPEHPFPTALLEGEAVLQALLSERATDRDKLLVGGDSAGGNLAAVLALHYSEELKGLWLLSPWLDLRVQSASYQNNGECDPMFSRETAQEAVALYLQGADERDQEAVDPDVSPLLGDLSKLPATMILVGSKEVLLDDALNFANRLAAAHGTLSLHVMPDMMHVEATLRYDTDYTRNVLTLSSKFLSDLCEETHRD